MPRDQPADEDRAEDSTSPLKPHHPPHEDDPLQRAGIGSLHRFGAYEIIDPESAVEGGMGVVFRARHVVTGSLAALKVPKPAYRRGQAAEAFVQEGTLLMNNPDDHLVRVFDVGSTEDGKGSTIPYMVMEYLPGAEPLTSRVDEDWSIERRLELFLGACSAVEHLHERGITHFDIKPSNVLVDSEGRLKVMDLGVSRLLHEPSISLPGGTYQFMSPEQLAGDAAALDHRCDVYSLGMVLYELLSGRLPYYIARHSDRHAAHQKALHASVPPLPVNDPLGCKLDEIVGRSLRKEPKDRLRSTSEFAQAVRAYLAALRKRQMLGRARRGFGWTAVLVGSALLAQILAPLLLSTPHQRWAGWMKSHGHEGGPVAHTSVIAITDDTDFDALAEKYHLEGVSLENRTSHRRLHGLLCQRLAQSSALCVVFDIKFRSLSEFDDDFASGLKA
ncbi:MAG: serine/threonine-protein kinase, partial [Candidatus Latescibacterota bacterium]|nr:serine/threonine-protein kinase [Candidatus Latescibacterota bacterium]